MREAVDLACTVAPYVDWIEAGPRLIKQHGIQVVSELKAAQPHKTLIAAMRIVDDAAEDVMMAINAGATLVTVLGAASDTTFSKAVQAAKRLGCGIIADMVGVTNPRTRAKRIAMRGAAYFQVCPSSDDPAALAGLVQDVATIASVAEQPVIVPGDLSEAALDRFRWFRPVAMRVRGSVALADDPVAAAQRLRELADLPPPQQQ